jgi:hypothetical protein
MALACRVSARTCLRVALHSRYQLSGGAPSKLGLAGFSRGAATGGFGRGAERY